MNEITLLRRDFIKKATLASASVIASTCAFANNETTKSHTQCSPTQPSLDIPFFGAHQAGITTPAQKHIYFLVADLHTDSLEEVKEMFQTWTEYSRNLTKGKDVKPYSQNAYIPPTDTGEADGLTASNLTLTFGVSPSFFSKLNLDKVKPTLLTDLPHFPRDQLQERYTGGDLVIQACADDPQVAFHAVRNLVRVARTLITMKWAQAGFNSAEGKNTPRNLFGFKDGTGNPQTPDKMAETVWVQSQDWLNGGSYLIVRRIRTFLETWDRTNLQSQNETFGRERASGAPMGEKAEFDEPDFQKKNAKGEPTIPETSHMHLARKVGVPILRRSYSYSDGIDDKGQFDAGLLFISFQKSPEQFIKIQNSLGNVDKMNEYITHIGSGLFACFAGVADENDYLGKALFEAV